MIYIPLKYLTNQTVVLETDIGGDVDDVGALVLLLDGAKKYGYKMGGVSLNRYAPEIVKGVRALLASRGFENLPIATAVNAPASVSSYLHAMAKHLPEEANLQTKSAMEFYEELFSKAEDGSVTIVSVGFLQNLDAVWRRNPALFEKKVRALVIMGGSFLYKPEYQEYNFNAEGHLSEATDFVGNFPGQVIYAGWETGAEVWTDVSPAKDASDPVVDAYFAFGNRPGCFPYRRESWDPVTADFAVIGEGEHYRLSPNVKVWLEDGRTCFAEDPAGKAAFVILNRSGEKVAEHINGILLDNIRRTHEEHL